MRKHIHSAIVILLAVLTLLIAYFIFSNINDGRHEADQHEGYSYTESRCRENMLDVDRDDAMKCYGMTELLLNLYGWEPLPLQTTPFEVTTDDDLRHTTCREDLDSLNKEELLSCHYDARIARSRLFFAA